MASGRPGLKPQLDDATLPAATDEITRLERERDEQLANIDRIQANIRTLPRTRGQLGELERDRKRAAEALDIEVKKMAEAESQDSLISANRGDTSRIQAPANLPAQPNPPASWVMLMASAILATLIALGVGLLLVYLDQTVYNEYELSRVTDLPVLVSIGRCETPVLPASVGVTEPPATARPQ